MCLLSVSSTSFGRSSLMQTSELSMEARRRSGSSRTTLKFLTNPGGRAFVVLEIRQSSVLHGGTDVKVCFPDKEGDTVTGWVYERSLVCWVDESEA